MFKQELIKFAENLFEIWKEYLQERILEGNFSVDLDEEDIKMLIPDKQKLESIVEETINKIEFENKTRDFYEEDEETKGFFRRLIEK